MNLIRPIISILILIIVLSSCSIIKEIRYKISPIYSVENILVKSFSLDTIILERVIFRDMKIAIDDERIKYFILEITNVNQFMDSIYLDLKTDGELVNSYYADFKAGGGGITYVSKDFVGTIKFIELNNMFIKVKLDVMIFMEKYDIKERVKGIYRFKVSDKESKKTRASYNEYLKFKKLLDGYI